MLVTPTTTVENWDSYCATCHNFPDPVGFLSATYEMTSDVEAILKKSKSAKELKKELSLFIKNRYSFHKEAEQMLLKETYKQHIDYCPE